MDGPSPNAPALLQVKNLKTVFKVPRGIVHAVDDVSFSVDAGRVLCIVGESGSGKSVTVRSLIRLVTAPGKIVGGEAIYGGRDLLKISETEMQALRGDKISMVFQNPITSLNPGMTVGNQIAESLILHRGMNKEQARLRVLELMQLVGIPAPSDRIDDYPARFSGGMSQRILIAAALACNPDILIADEPTTALDVSMQAQILRLLKDTQAEVHNALIMITHDLGVVATIADDVLVMYAGRVVEHGPVREIFGNPRHPYTQGLIDTVRALEDASREIRPIPGNPAVPLGTRVGCSFAPRCRFADGARCRTLDPVLENIGPQHTVACHVKPEMTDRDV